MSQNRLFAQIVEEVSKCSTAEEAVALKDSLLEEDISKDKLVLACIAASVKNRREADGLWDSLFETITRGADIVSLPADTLKQLLK